jgi:predicted HicB family RNase H-like nuclease
MSGGLPQTASGKRGIYIPDTRCQDISYRNGETTMKGTMTQEYKGYTADIRYCEEDGLLVGHVAGISAIIGFHGESVSDLRKAFEEAVDFYLETEPNPEKPFSGRISLQVTPEIHAELFRKDAFSC